MRDTLAEWTLKPLVQALQAMRGVQLIAAMAPVAALQDFLRFANPRQILAYVGLVPGGYSSGSKRRQGSITKAGNSVARRMLVEVAWKAQLRLNAKFKRLLALRVMKARAVVAVARELAAAGASGETS